MVSKRSTVRFPEAEWRTTFFAEVAPEILDPDATVVMAESQERLATALLRRCALSPFQAGYSRYAWSTLRWLLAGGGAKGWCDSVRRRTRRSVIVVRNPQTGTETVYPTQDRRGTESTTPRGERIKQQKLWWEMTIDEYRTYRDRRRAELATDVRENAQLDVVDDAILRVPNAQTPGDALRACGIDPQSIAISL